MYIFISKIFFLQSFSQFTWKNSPLHVAITLVIFALIAGVMIYLNVSKRVASSKVMQSGTIDLSEAIKSVSPDFMQIARQYGISRHEAAFLEGLFNDCGIKPAAALRDTKALDDNFLSAYRILRRENDDSDEGLKKMTMFFSIRNAVEYKTMFTEISRSGKNYMPRRYRRKSVKLSCTFCNVFVHQVKQGLKQIQKLTEDKTKLTGTLIDISAGGCSIATPYTIKAGSRIKIEFKTGRAQIAALGTLLRVNRDSRGAVIHVQFQKVPAKSLVYLNAFIFDYND